MSNFKTAESASGLGMNYSAICLVAASENFKATHLSGILPWAKCARVSINCVCCNGIRPPISQVSSRTHVVGSASGTPMIG